MPTSTPGCCRKRIIPLLDINKQLRSMTLHFLRLIEQIGHAWVKGRYFYSQEDWKNKLADWEKLMQKKPIAEKTWLKSVLDNMKTVEEMIQKTNDEPSLKI